MGDNRNTTGGLRFRDMSSGEKSKKDKEGTKAEKVESIEVKKAGNIETKKGENIGAKKAERIEVEEAGNRQFCY